MDDRIGRGLEDRLAHGVRVEQVERDRLCPERSTRAAFAGDLEVPMTSWPRSIGWGTSRVPMAPLAPTTKTLMVLPFFGSVTSPGLRGSSGYDPTRRRNVTDG